MDEKKKAPDYGEPWLGGASRSKISRRGGEEIGDMFVFPVFRERAVVCVNALAGCPDPEVFVNLVRKWVEFEVHRVGGEPEGYQMSKAMSWLLEKPDA